MASSYSRARYRPHPARPNDGPAPNLSARGFDGCKPRTHLAADPAYVRAGNSWAYICLPGDLANREVAGHSVGVRHDPDLVPAAFAMLRFPLGGIEVFHTDRGGEFTGERIERMLDVFGITRFLSNPGSPYDDAVVESTNRLIRRSSYTPTRTRAWNNCARTPPVRMVVQPPAAPLDPRIHEPRGVHQTRKHPLETVQHTVANPSLTRS